MIFMTLELQHTKMPYSIDVPNVGTILYSAASIDYLSHPEAVAYARKQGGNLASLAQLGFFKAARFQPTFILIDRARDWPQPGADWRHSGTLVSYGDGVMRPWEPDQDTLERISQAGYEANSKGDELIYDLRSETKDPVVLAIRKAWIEGIKRQALLPTQNWNELSLLPAESSAFETCDITQALMQQGAHYLADDLRSERRTEGIVYCLIAKDLTEAGLEAGDGKVLIRPSRLGYDRTYSDYVGVVACGQFGRKGWARAVAEAPKSPSEKQGE